MDDPISSILSELSSNPNALAGLQKFLGNKFQATDIVPQKKPTYSDNIPPVYSKTIILGLEKTNGKDADIDRFTQFRIYIKAPTQRFPTSAIMVQLKNPKSSCFSRLGSVDELSALFEWLSAVIPEVREKMDNLKPLEAQQQLANDAYTAVMKATEIEAEGDFD